MYLFIHFQIENIFELFLILSINELTETPKSEQRAKFVTNNLLNSNTSSKCSLKSKQREKKEEIMGHHYCTNYTLICAVIIIHNSNPSCYVISNRFGDRACLIMCTRALTLGSLSVSSKGSAL